MKSTVVLKDINSNLIEEAIIVFKENVKIKEKQLIERKNKETGKENNDENNVNSMEKIVLSEAKSVILNYLEECEKEKKDIIQKRKMRLLKIVNIFLIVLLVIATIF